MLVLAGLYLHVPFCTSFCLYCDFYSLTRTELIGAYAEALEAEAGARSGFFGGVPPETLYLGGGTPSVLPPAIFVRVMRMLDRIFWEPSGSRLADAAERTMEVNPDDVTPEKASLWRSCGIGRISMGVQSFRDPCLKWMLRRHSGDGAERAYRILREAGFENISLDLIFGYEAAGGREKEELAGWEEDIARMVALRPEHISAYQMSVEPGSALADRIRAGKARELDAEICAKEYAVLQERLESAGYRQYEVSNFARPGREARHNSAYWDRTPYLGLGPSAHSFDGRMRSWNAPDLDVYLAVCRQAAAGGGYAAESEILNEREIFDEQLMLGLRKRDGLDPESLAPELLHEIRPALEQALRRGDLLCGPDGKIRIPPERLFVSDGIICDLMLP